MHKYVTFQEFSGYTDDGNPKSGSNQRYALARGLEKKGLKVFIMEDSDKETGINEGNVKRLRHKRKNIDSYFLNPEFVAKAFNVEKAEIELIYIEGGYTYIDEKATEWLKDQDGKNMLRSLNEKLGRSKEEGTPEANKWIEAHDICECIDNFDSISPDLQDIAKYVEWLLKG